MAFISLRKIEHLVVLAYCSKLELAKDICLSTMHKFYQIDATKSELPWHHLKKKNGPESLSQAVADNEYDRLDDF